MAEAKNISDEAPAPNNGVIRCGNHFCLEFAWGAEELKIFLLDKQEKPVSTRDAALKIQIQHSPNGSAIDLRLSKNSRYFAAKPTCDENTFNRSLLKVHLKVADQADAFEFVIDRGASPFKRSAD